MTFFQFISRFASHFSFLGAVSIDATGNDHARTLALGLYLISFMIDHGG